MHVLFVHKNFPAQFGHIAAYLAAHEGFQCTFVSEREPGESGGVRRIQYKVGGGATAATHYCSRTFENYTWHSHAVYETLKAHPEVRPDLVVGHSGFGSTVFLADLYECPIVNYFEYYYRSRNSDMDFRSEFPLRPIDCLRCRTRNAGILVDLQTCAAGYCATQWQRSLFPSEYAHKLETIFDGIDTDFWRRLPDAPQEPRRIGDREIPSGVKIVTYVSRGFESMRGFDIFMKIAKRLCELRRDLLFVCVGSDRVCYGGDENRLEGETFRQHVLAQDDYDPARFLFTGHVRPVELLRILNLSDLHVYLTVPFVLSWSLMNALACGCTVLASNTAPVREMIEAGRNGLLADFYDVDGFVRQALEVLDDPPAYRPLGARGMEIVQQQYSLRVALPKMLDLYRRVVNGRLADRPECD
jgi:glycosyltransferase involved in cell wall biosynthesis